MIDFGQTINLQPHILGWLVNGENSGLAERFQASEKAVGDNKIKKVYKGDIEQFVKNYLILTHYSAVDLYPDRKSNVRFDKRTIMRSLLEYKSRWNQEGTGAKLYIDNINYKGKYLEIKTTEDLPINYPAILVEFYPLTGAVDVANTGVDPTITFPWDVKINPVGTYELAIGPDNSPRYQRWESVDGVITGYTNTTTPNSNTLEFSGDTVTVTFASGGFDSFATDHSVIISPGMFISIDDVKSYEGIVDRETWKFTTVQEV